MLAVKCSMFTIRSGEEEEEVEREREWRGEEREKKDNLEEEELLRSQK